jgi:hypothetical protein
VADVLFHEIGNSETEPHTHRLHLIEKKGQGMNRFKGISQKFRTEAAAVGRLLAGYADLEISLLHCVQMARGGDLDAVLKAMFGTRGETRRISTASALGQPAYDSVGLGSQFATAIDDMRFFLDIRNCYAHSLWHDANAGYLAFVNLEELATTSTIVTDLMGLTIKYLDMPILTAQEDYLDFVDHSIQYLNYEGRFRRGDLSSNPVPAPPARARPPLCR